LFKDIPAEIQTAWLRKVVLRISQQRYRRQGLARLGKGIPAEIQTSWFSKVGQGYPSGYIDAIV
jgi:hypothetical protein